MTHCPHSCINQFCALIFTSQQGNRNGIHQNLLHGSRKSLVLKVRMFQPSNGGLYHVTRYLFTARCYAQHGLRCRKMNVCIVSIVETAKQILKHFPPSGRHTILVFPHQTSCQYSDAEPLTGASNAGVIKNCDFWQIPCIISETIQDRAIVTNRIVLTKFVIHKLDDKLAKLKQTCLVWTALLNCIIFRLYWLSDLCFRWLCTVLNYFNFCSFSLLNFYFV